MAGSCVDFTLKLDELYNDSARCRAILQNNEDKIEEFNKWSENMIRFVKTILEEASSIICFKVISQLNFNDVYFRNGPDAPKSWNSNEQIFIISRSFWYFEKKLAL